jgi:hypothetical protein
VTSQAPRYARTVRESLWLSQYAWGPGWVLGVAGTFSCWWNRAELRSSVSRLSKVEWYISEGQEKYLRELSITPVGYFTGAIKNHSRAVFHRNYFAWRKWGISEELFFYGRDRPRPSNYFTGVFRRWRDRARFLTFTDVSNAIQLLCVIKWCLERMHHVVM